MISLSYVRNYCDAFFVDGYYNLTTSLIYTKAKPTAGLFSPFDLTPGGGEKYFLTVAQVLYSMGYEIELILRDENKCVDVDCIKKTLQALRVGLTVDQFKVRLVNGDEYLNMYTHDTLVLQLYDVFFYIANSKWPQIYPSGEYNIFMCQFPFDLYHSAKYYEIQRLWKYDIVLVNSRFSHEWYVRSILRDTQKYLRTNSFIPALAIAHPPIEPFISFANDFNSLPKLPDREKVMNIVVLGRFFQGRQSKGHDVAVSILANILRKTSKKNIHLYLCGYIHADGKATDYVESLKANVTKANLPVTFVTNADTSKITSILQEATILWHLTGVLYLSKPREDPASFEHFGIAIVEAMYMGMIPMVTNIGGPLDIVKHKVNGYLCSTVEDYVAYFLEIQSMTDAEIANMRAKAYHAASKYTTQHFQNKLQSIIANGVLTMNHLSVVKNHMKNKKKLTTDMVTPLVQSRYFAIIIESGMNPLLEFTVRNIYRYLNSTFTIQIYHTILNENLVKNQIRGIKLQHFASGLSLYLQEDYENLLKSPSFWQKYQPTDKLLFFNTDSFIVSDNLVWLKSIMDKYDYVSAPITSSRIDIEVKNRGGSNPVPYADKNKKYTLDEYRLSDKTFDKNIMEDADMGIGSGISIRTAGPMLRIATMFENNTDSDEPESIFFLRHMKELGYKVADLQTSYEFAWEYEIPGLNVKGGRPYAIHSAWVFMNRRLISDMMNDYVVKDLIDIVVGPLKDTVGQPKTVTTVDHSRVGLLPGHQQAVQTSLVSTTSENTGEKPLSALWDLLHQPSSYIGNSMEEANKIFKALGFSERSDLAFIDDENLKKINTLLKPVPSKKLKIMMTQIKS